MYCEKCGASLPSKGYICQNCGMMMNIKQIKTQKSLNDETHDLKFLSDMYRKDPINRDYKKNHENKYLGILFIILVILILIILAIIKVI